MFSHSLKRLKNCSRNRLFKNIKNIPQSKTFVKSTLLNSLPGLPDFTERLFHLYPVSTGTAFFLHIPLSPL